MDDHNTEHICDNISGTAFENKSAGCADGKRSDYLETPLWDSRRPLAERIAWLLGEMTIDEKLRFLGTSTPELARLGIVSNHIGGEAAHGVEARHDQDGRGVPEPTTSFPQPIGMSASWDTELIGQAGRVVGKEARVLYERYPHGGLFRWAPTVDIERDPRWGRTEEGYGEDPFLTGKMAAAYVRGMQGDDPEHLLISSALKHFFANNVEDGRGVKSSSIDARTRNEYYYEPFRRVVEEGGATSVMTAYNKVNGVVQMLDHRVNELIREKWGLDGHVVCDGGAMSMAANMHHATQSHAETVAKSLKAGVDCMTDQPDVVEAAAREAYQKGWITEEDIDRALAHSFATKLRLGMYDAYDANPWCRLPESELNSAENQAVSRKLAQESVVLLKNEGLLPLSKDKKVCVLGPLADVWYQDWYGGEPAYRTTVLEGVRETLGGCRASGDGRTAVSGTAGDDGIALDGISCDGRTAVPETSDGGQRVVTRALADAQAAVTLDRSQAAMIGAQEAEAPVAAADGLDRIYLRCGARYAALDADNRLILTDDREKAELFVAQDWGSGQFTFYVPRLSRYLMVHDDGFIVADKKDLFGWFVKECFTWTQDCFETWYHCGLYLRGDGLVAAKRLAFETPVGEPQGGELETTENAGHSASLQFESEVIESGTQRAVSLAAQSDAAVLVLGCCPVINGKEDADRPSIEFPPSQRALAQAVFAVNPNTVLVLISNYPYAIDWEQEHLPAILWLASGGQDMGRAAADVLFGDCAPAGRLNMTWYSEKETLPDIDDYDIAKTKRTYRYYTGEPLYAFGHGLTYSPFVYRDLSVAEEGASVPDMVVQTCSAGAQIEKVQQVTEKEDVEPCTCFGSAGKCDTDNKTPDLRIALTIENCGIYTSDEVVQFYVREPSGRVPKAVRRLIAFERVHDILPGESRRVTFTIPRMELRYYDVVSGSFLVEKGTYTFEAGASSSDIRLQTDVKLSGGSRGLRRRGSFVPADHWDDYENAVLGVGHTDGMSGEDCSACVKDSAKAAWLVYRDCEPFSAGAQIKLLVNAPENGSVTLYAGDICTSADMLCDGNGIVHDNMPPRIEGENARDMMTVCAGNASAEAATWSGQTNGFEKITLTVGAAAQDAQAPFTLTIKLTGDARMGGFWLPE